MKNVILPYFLFTSCFLFGQKVQTVIFNEEYLNVTIDSANSLIFELNLKRGEVYQFYILQKGIDVFIELSDEKRQKILDKDSPNGSNGLEYIVYAPTLSQTFYLTINRFDETTNEKTGLISYYFKNISKPILQLREKTKNELVSENKKNVLTADIDHFWEAYDQLKTCKTFFDSVATIQNIYLERATDGLKDFILKRNFTADKYVFTLQKEAKFYNTVRINTLEVKKAEPLIQEVFDKLKGIYPNFKPFKVCFAIGFMQTGGTVSQNFVLIGTELMASGKIESVPRRIKGIVAHECIHTQQPDTMAKDAIICPQLTSCLREGAANFIGELVTGETNYGEVNQYGEKNEKKLWQTYYNNAQDKKQAIIDIIEITGPVSFLQKSKYDKQAK